ncbi:hypothetical protein A3SI_02708 [Nitritalea halalkaliphila LW7]|uniref:Uncharacterized protein n=1 Tax=Nitritalea halalkaliphila LW7 TaxID=1189621 RepID=I5C9E0_9BACT|nr:hypothetical protein [Nitritalea halalkaliphila]EIM78442.1 hypothetical protein A3SI_02708 [Nitritalea halalkaliphila LW7]
MVGSSLYSTAGSKDLKNEALGSYRGLCLLYGKAFCLLLGLFFLLSGSLFAQGARPKVEPVDKYILIQKGGKKRTAMRYRVGEELTYKLKGEPFFVTDRIVNIQADLIEMRENILTLERIEAVDISQKDTRNQTISNLSTVAIGGGLLFLGAESVNQLNQEGRLSISRGVWISSAAMIAAGIGIRQLKTTTVPIGKAYKMQLILIYEDDPTL